MAQYINKDALIAEIERRRDLHFKNYVEKGFESSEGKYDEDKHILSFINTIEVKEVDLDSNIRAYLTNYFNVYEDGVLQSKKSSHPLSTYDIIKVAKHFFELGMAVRNKAQKGE